MTYKVLLTCIGLALMVSISCGSSNVEVKPDTTSSHQPTTSPQLENDTKALSGNLALNDTEEEKLDLANSNHLALIQYTCGFYLTAYGSMPETLDDLLDGLAFLWPGSVMTGKPIKILDVKPDPKNPAHIDGVFYEKINSHSAKLFFLYKNPLASNGDDEWGVTSFDITPSTGNAGVNEGEWEESPFITEMNQNERFWFAYQRNLYITMPFLMYDAIDRRSVVENNIVDLLRNSQYFIIDSGLEKMVSGLSENRLKFDMGSIVDSNRYYADNADLKGNLKIYCFGINENGNRSRNEKCPEVGFVRNSIINSTDFDPNAIPVDLIITKADVH
jgi:hypothetical protein